MRLMRYFPNSQPALVSGTVNLEGSSSNSCPPFSLNNLFETANIATLEAGVLAASCPVQSAGMSSDCHMARNKAVAMHAQTTRFTDVRPIAYVPEALQNLLSSRGGQSKPPSRRVRYHTVYTYTRKFRVFAIQWPKVETEALHEPLFNEGLVLMRRASSWSKFRGSSMASLRGGL